MLRENSEEPEDVDWGYIFRPLWIGFDLAGTKTFATFARLARNALDSQPRSRPVARAARDFLPRRLVNFIKVRVDRELFAARRAAKHNRPSTDAKLYLLAANLALHIPHLAESMG